MSAVFRDNGAIEPASAVTPEAAAQAAQWLVLVHSGEMTDSQRRACEQWRGSHPDHELAWRRAELVAQKFGLVPAAVGTPVLRRAAAANRRAAIKTLALLMTAGPATWAAYRMAPWSQWTSDVHTVTGEQRTVQLPDGSQLTLNTASAVDVAFDANTRRVSLRSGEILVVTAADPAPVARPFIVESGQGSMRALGTRFIVRQNENSSHLAVTEGAVEVTPRANGAPRYVVAAGRQTDFTEQGGGVEMLAAHADAWATGVLYAEKMSLGQFVAEIARYRKGILRCDPTVADMQVSGAFQLGDTDAVIKALVESLPIRVQFVTRYWATIGPL